MQAASVQCMPRPPASAGHPHPSPAQCPLAGDTIKLLAALPPLAHLTRLELGMGLEQRATLGEGAIVKGLMARKGAAPYPVSGGGLLWPPVASC